MKHIPFWVAASLLTYVLAGCGQGGTATANEVDSGLTGTITIDGSSTVEPISSAAAEEFAAIAPNVKVPVSLSGTSGGFKKFLNKEIDICDASRPITEKEMAEAQAKGIEYIELPVAFDGLSVVVNKGGTFVDHLTIAELKKIWEPGSKINNWSQVRAGWPDQKIELYGPGHDSGTFDYFTEAIMGKKGASREDYQPSENDNQLVQGVAGQNGALGYFGFAYYEQNQDKLKIVPIDGGTGPITPSAETIKTGTYSPLSRPLFIYVNKASAERPEVKAFVKFYLEHAQDLVASAQYVALNPDVYTLCLARLDAMKTGTIFGGKPQVGVKLEDLLKMESK
jgi:phosphate transport system substrate-binding protein